MLPGAQPSLFSTNGVGARLALCTPFSMSDSVRTVNCRLWRSRCGYQFTEITLRRETSQPIGPDKAIPDSDGRQKQLRSNSYDLDHKVRNCGGSRTSRRTEVQNSQGRNASGTKDARQRVERKSAQQHPRAVSWKGTRNEETVCRCGGGSRFGGAIGGGGDARRTGLRLPTRAVGAEPKPAPRAGMRAEPEPQPVPNTWAAVWAATTARAGANPLPR